MKYTTRDLTTMEMIDVTVADFKNNPDARLDTIYVSWHEMHEVRMAFQTWNMKEWPHEFVSMGENLFKYHDVYIKYDEKVEL